MDRLEAIMNFRKNENDKKSLEQKRELEEIEILKGKVVELKPRIDELLKTANVCLENYVWFDTCNAYNREQGFLADGITHKIGFIQDRTNFVRNNQIKYLGIRGGGFCEEFDFITNGSEAFMIRHHDVSNTWAKDATLGYLRQFVNEFSNFETAFYEYIDKKINFTSNKE